MDLTKLTFDEKEHKYYYDGKSVVSANVMIGVAYELFTINEAYRKNLEDAIERGNKVHKILEVLFNTIGNTEERQTQLENIGSYTTQHKEIAKRIYKKIKNKYLDDGWEVEFTEKKLVGESVEVIYAGTPDLLLKRGDGDHTEFLLVDYKTNKTFDNKKMKKYQLQVGLYKELIWESYIEKKHSDTNIRWDQLKSVIIHCSVVSDGVYTDAKIYKADFGINFTLALLQMYKLHMLKGRSATKLLMEEIE